MKAIICAAGRGTRLGASAPKVLLEFAGRTLLEWHALRLRDCGVKELVIVTGHERAQISTALSGLHGLTVRDIPNERFTEGSVLSLSVAIPQFENGIESLLLMDADVLYPTEMLRRLMESKHPTALLLDRNYSTADDDPVLVPVRDGRPFDFRKQWDGEADFVGESIGFFKIAPADFPMLIDETRRRSDGDDVRESYDDALRAMVLAGRFGYEDVSDLPWTEIDFPEDVIRARDEVLPAILRMT